MKIVIAGAGRAGTAVAVHLASSGHSVTMLDRDPAATRRAFDDLGLMALTGDATDAALLESAEIGRADVVVAMLRRDADNLAFALLARAAGAGRVMVRMRDVAYRPVYLAAGVARILSELDVFVGVLATSIEHDAVRHAMLLGDGHSIAFELALDAQSVVAGQTVRELAADPQFPPSCVLAGLYREGGAVEAPRGDSLVLGGSRVLLVSRRSEVGAVVKFFDRRVAEAKLPRGA